MLTIRGQSLHLPAMAKAAYPGEAGRVESRLVHPAEAPPRGNRVTWLEDHDVLTAAERLRRACHRLDREAAPSDVGPIITRVEHEIGVCLVGPERRRPEL